MLTTGDPAPSFTLPDHNGEAVSLSDFSGAWVLLWWYAKAATPG
jgi:peroxiredoxin Q/BCP